MRLTSDSDQLELRAAVRAFLERTSPMAKVREAIASDLGYDPAVWKRLSTELGIPALAISESGGGSGFGVTELAIALEECGAALVPGPLLDNVACGLILDAIGDTSVLPRLAAGDTVAALVSGSSATTNGQTISGTASGVVGGAAAELLVVLTDDGVFAVEADEPGVTRRSLMTMDLTRRQASVEFSGAPALRLGGAEQVALGMDKATVALAAESLGVMRRSVELATEYAKVREQFGRKIGSFQAVKQGIADIYASFELASAAVAYAAWTADHAPEELSAAASLCKVYVVPQAFEAAFQMLHVHGGIGYTWEHDAHFYFKRAKANEALLGFANDHLERLAHLLLDQETTKIGIN